MKKINEVIERIEPLDEQAMEAAQKRLDSLTKPQGSLGRLEELAKKVAGITKRVNNQINNKVVVVMAADHGVVEEKVSAYPQAVTSQMVYNFLEGGAGINILARFAGARLILVDMGVASEFEPSPELIDKKIDHGSKNMARGPAMSVEQAKCCIKSGVELVEQELKEGRKIDILGTGDMGIGNTTPSSAVIATFTGESPKKVTGRGTGIDDELLTHKVEVVEKSLRINKPNPSNPIDVLAKVGGFEIGGLAGVILAAAANRIPVVIDGLISGASAMLAAKLQPLVRDYLIAGHNSVEVGHTVALKHLNLKPLLNFDLRLGEGTGAALGISLVEAASRIINDMATFSEASVSESLE